MVHMPTHDVCHTTVSGALALSWGRMPRMQHASADQCPGRFCEPPLYSRPLHKLSRTIVLWAPARNLLRQELDRRPLVHQEDDVCLTPTRWSPRLSSPRTRRLPSDSMRQPSRYSRKQPSQGKRLPPSPDPSRRSKRPSRCAGAPPGPAAFSVLLECSHACRAPRPVWATLLPHQPAPAVRTSLDSSDSSTGAPIPTSRSMSKGARDLSMTSPLAAAGNQ